MKQVGIISTGVANLASVTAALNRVGATSYTIENPDDILMAAYIVVPGVGAFSSAMAALSEQNFVAPLSQRIQSGRATLAICLGMQILCSGSDESPGVAGLGIIPQRVERMATDDLPVPQMGWNTVIPQISFNAVDSGYAYFANSYAILNTNIPNWQIATFDYGNTYIAALQYQNVLACQFHPELSGTWGQQLINNWLERAPC